MVIYVTETSGNKVKKSSCPAYVYKEAIAKIMKEMEEILGKSDGLEIKPSENAIDEPWTYPFVDDEKETTIKSNLTGLFDNNSPSRRECNLWLYENGDINKLEMTKRIHQVEHIVFAFVFHLIQRFIQFRTAIAAHRHNIQRRFKS